MEHSETTQTMSYNDEQTKGLFKYFLLFVIGLILSFIFVSYLFLSYKDEIFKENIATSQVDINLKTLLEYEQNELNNYGYVDKAKGIVRIPIEEAMKKVENNYQK